MRKRKFGLLLQSYYDRELNSGEADALRALVEADDADERSVVLAKKIQERKKLTHEAGSLESVYVEDEVEFVQRTLNRVKDHERRVTKTENRLTHVAALALASVCVCAVSIYLVAIDIEPSSKVISELSNHSDTPGIDEVTEAMISPDFGEDMTAIYLRTTRFDGIRIASL